MPDSCGLCNISREATGSKALCPIHGDDEENIQDYAWKVTNDEGFIPPASYYVTDKVAARFMEMEEYEVTIIFLEE